MKKLLVIAAVFACFSCADVDMAKKYPNMAANLEPIPLGSIEASFDRMFSSKLKIYTINTAFHPRENAVVLEWGYELIKYRQFWDQNSRQAFIDALEKYNEDFNARNLVFKYSKSRAAYGKVKGRLEWENAKFTSTYKSSPVWELGYRFRNENPFFTVMQRLAKDERKNTGDRIPIESSAFAMYFTKAQGDVLAQLFRQDFLMGLISANAKDEKAPVLNEPAGDYY